MESQPERPVEKWLRAAATKRREEAAGPFKLHPADRRLLQDEVSRVFPKPAPQARGFQNWWRALPRLAWGIGLVAVLGVVVWIVVPKQAHDSEMLAFRKDTDTRAAIEPDKIPTRELQPFDKFAGAAANEPTAPATASPAAQPGPARSAELALALEESRSALASTKEKGEPAAGVAAARVVAAPPAEAPATTPTPAEPSVLSARRFGLARPNATPAAPPAGIAPTNVLAFRSQPLADIQHLAVADALQNVRVSQQFSNLTLPAATTQRKVESAAKPLSSQVLNNFNVEQTGNELKVVDQDGSVYAGFVEAEAMTTQGKAAGRAGSIGGEIAKQQVPADQSQNYFFRVAGTNRSLNQRVVFTGNFLPGTNTMAQSLDVLRNQAALNERRQQQNALRVPPVQLQNFRVAGEAIVGERQQLMINAVPAGK